jgi:hypothetical protein
MAMDVKRFLAPVLVGVVVAAVFGTWMFTTRHSATPDVVEGWAMPNMHGTAISLHDSDDTRDGDGYIIAGAQWSGQDNVWHQGADGPTCVGTDTTRKTHVRLGIVDVSPDEGVPGRPYVMWLRCLD